MGIISLKTFAPACTSSYQCPGIGGRIGVHSATYMIRAAKFGEYIAHNALQLPILKSVFQVLHKMSMAVEYLHKFPGE